MSPITRRALLALAIALAAVAAVAALAMTSAQGATWPAAPPPSCTHAYGQCEVIVYRYHQRNGTIGIWTCYTQLPVKPGASNIWIAVTDCFRP